MRDLILVCDKTPKGKHETMQSYNSARSAQKKSSKESLAPTPFTGGFIALHRQIRAHWLWQYREPQKLMWWLDILMEVNFEDKRVLMNGQLVECKRGQTLRSQLEWERRWRASRSAVRNFLELLRKEGMITTESVANTTRLTVCKYEDYQGQRPTERTTEDTTERTTEDTQHNKANNLNNENNVSAAEPSLPKKSVKKNWEERESDFLNELETFKTEFGENLIKEFFRYWSEPNKSKTKMKWELQKTWETKRRLQKWRDNEGRFGGKPKNGNPAVLGEINYDDIK